MGKQSRRRGNNQPISQFSGCSHSGAAVAPLRKGLAKNPDFTVCKECLRTNRKSSNAQELVKGDGAPEEVVSAEEEPYKLFACMRCCHIACERHVQTHFKAPRSDIHSHFICLATRQIICVACQGLEIDENEHHILSNCVQIITQALKRAVPSAELPENDWRALALKKAHSDSVPPNNSKPALSVTTPKPTPPPKQTPLGLPNLGSTCYLNSSLQGLAASCAVRQCFAQFSHQQCTVLVPNGDEPLAEVVIERQEGALPERLADVLRRIRPFDSEWCDEGYCSTKPMRNRLVGLKTEFAHRYPDFTSDTTEQDSHEFLRYFLDLLSQNVDKRVNEACKEDSAAFSGSVIDGLFRCTLLTVRHCNNCSGFSTKTEHVLDLCLALDKEVTNCAPPRPTERKAVATTLSKHKLKKARKDKRKMKKKKTPEPGSSGPVSPSEIKDGEVDSAEVSSEEGEAEKNSLEGKLPEEDEEEDEEEEDTNNYDIFECTYLSAVKEESREAEASWNSPEEAAADVTKGNSSVDSAIVVSGEDSDNQSGGSAALPPGANEPVSKFHDVFSWTANSGAACTGDLLLPNSGVEMEYMTPCATDDERTEALIQQLISEEVSREGANDDEEEDCNPYAAFWDDTPVGALVDNRNVSISSESLVSKNFSNAGNSVDCNVSEASFDGNFLACDQALRPDSEEAEEENGGKEEGREEEEKKGAEEKEEEEEEEEEQEPGRELEPDVAQKASETQREMPELRPSSLVSLLAKYFQLSPIEDFRCGRCKAKGTSSSRQFLIELPPVLLINMKRFWRPMTAHGETRKIYNFVEFPLELDVGAFASRLAVPAPSRYRLRGLIQHMGSVRTGHYVAYVSVTRPVQNAESARAQLSLKVSSPPTTDDLADAFTRLQVRPEDEAAESSEKMPEAGRTSELRGEEEEEEEWFLVSDTSVSRASVRDVLSAEAYILLYERLTP